MNTIVLLFAALLLIGCAPRPIAEAESSGFPSTSGMPQLTVATPNNQPGVNAPGAFASTNALR